MKQASRSKKCHTVNGHTRKNEARRRLWHAVDMIIGGEVEAQQE